MALFLFLLVKMAPASLPNVYFVALRPPVPFRQTQFAQVFPLKLASFCKLSANLGRTNGSAISLLLLSDSRYAFAILSLSPSLFLPQILWQIWQELYSLSSFVVRLQCVPKHSFLPEHDAPYKLTRRGALLVPSPIPCSLSPLASHFLLLFPSPRGVLSHLNSSTRRFHQFPL